MVIQTGRRRMLARRASEGLSRPRSSGILTLNEFWAFCVNIAIGHKPGAPATGERHPSLALRACVQSHSSEGKLAGPPARTSKLGKPRCRPRIRHSQREPPSEVAQNAGERNSVRLTIVPRALTPRRSWVGTVQRRTPGEPALPRLPHAPARARRGDGFKTATNSACASTSSCSAASRTSANVFWSLIATSRS